MTREEQIYADLQRCIQLAVAGSCQYSVGGKHAFFQDILEIGDKYKRDALGELQPLSRLPHNPA